MFDIHITKRPFFLSIIISRVLDVSETYSKYSFDKKIHADAVIKKMNAFKTNYLRENVYFPPAYWAEIRKNVCFVAQAQ